MRAVSVSFSPRGSFVGGLLRAGQYVDVHLTPQLNDPTDTRFRGGLTITLLGGVRVLAVAGGGSGADSISTDSISTVTLELTPEQANMLILAREKGEIALSYNPDGKGRGGVAVKNQDRATMDEILGLNRPDAPVSAPRLALARSPATPTKAARARRCNSKTAFLQARPRNPRPMQNRTGKGEFL